MESQNRSSTPYVVVGVLFLVLLLIIIGATQIFGDEEDNGAVAPSGVTTEITATA